AWFELGCSAKPGGAAAGCAKVLASQYSYFPGLPHIPVAFIGLMYYSTLLAWLVGVGRPGFAKRGLHYAAFLLVTLGLGGSAYFVDHVSRDFGVVCVVHVYACAQFADFHLHDFYVAEAAAVGGEGIATEGSVAAVAAVRTGGAAHPSARVFILTLIGIVLVNYAHVNMLGLKTWR